MYKDPAMHRAYTLEYRKQNLRRFTLDLRPEVYNTWKQAADEAGVSIASMIKKAMSQMLSTDNDTG